MHRENGKERGQKKQFDFARCHKYATPTLNFGVVMNIGSGMNRGKAGHTGNRVADALRYLQSPATTQNALPICYGFIMI